MNNHYQTWNNNNELISRLIRKKKYFKQGIKSYNQSGKN